jgi:death on curing protein
VSERIEFLTVEDIEMLHEDQLRSHGGLDGLRDRGALESAIAAPASTFDDELLDPGVFDMAAAYAFHIAQNHPFLDGNKRTALNAALVFLGMNGWDVDDPNERLYEAMVGITEHRVTKSDFAILLRDLATSWTDP